MARIKRGLSNHARTRAKNFTQKEAQARLTETVAPFNRQVENSLFVDAVEVDFYQSCAKTGKPCTCEKIELRPEFNTITHAARDTNVAPIVPTVDDDSSAGLEIHLQDDSLFGDSPAEKLYGATVYDVSGNDFIEDDDIPEALYDEITTKEGDSSFEETTMFGSNANCGICYKTGFQPGYVAYGKQRSLLTSWDIERIGSYTLNTTGTPNSLRRQGPVGAHTFVEFAISVPKFFKTCIVSVRNNIQVLIGEKLLVDGSPLTIATLKQYAGKRMPLRVNAEEFTHVVLEFDLGLDKLRANIGTESQMLDYSKLEAMGTFPVVLPPSVPEVNIGDALIIKDRRLALKVTDKERKITADKRRLEWVLQARVIQRTEPLRDIHKGIKLL